jgi:hypothetical protein
MYKINYECPKNELKTVQLTTTTAYILSKIRHLQASKVQHGSSGQRVNNHNTVLADCVHTLCTPRVHQNKRKYDSKAEGTMQMKLLME